MEIVVISQEQVAAAIAQHIGSEIRLSNVTKTGSYRTFLFENEIEEGTVSEKSKLVWDTIATDEKGHKCPGYRRVTYATTRHFNIEGEELQYQVK